LYIWYRSLVRAMRALMEGRFEEGERLAQQALAIGQRAGNPTALQAFGGQMLVLRREQGRLGELEAAVKGFVEQYPALPVWRAVLALVCSELGRESEARSEFERLAANEFADLPRDSLWLTAVALLADVCTFLGDVDRAARLYEVLLPYAGQNATLPFGIFYFGSVSQYLGMLAGTMGRWEEAERHFEDALQVHGRMGARPWLAHTQHEYARMLHERVEVGDGEKAHQLVNQALDTAQELGMKSLVERALALKMELQGIAYGDVRTSIAAVAATVQSERPDLPPKAVAPDGTVTLLFTDIEGSTALNERLGDQRWLELLREHNGIVRECLQAHDGYEVKTIGDGFMVVFGDAGHALRCAIVIQRAFAERNESAEEPVRVRIGLHTGEAVKEAGDFYGKHVVLASRIADEARGGEILVSSLLRELTESAGDIVFGEGREVKLKGLSGRQRVYEARWS
jgi:class 3 adenylate cyclase